MTELLSVVPVLRPTVGAGGSTGLLPVVATYLICLLLTFYSTFSCFESNLNGEYMDKPEDNGYYRGIIWELWLGDYSLKETKMMIRPGGQTEIL